MEQERIIEQLDRVHADAAVAAGTMSPQDAEASLERVRDGDHSTGLRRHIRGVD
jgi:hypothetical protein